MNVNKIIESVIKEYFEEDSTMKFIEAAERDEHINGIEASANYIVSAAKKIALEFDKLHHEEKRVMGKTYYERFLKDIGKM